MPFKFLAKIILLIPAIVFAQHKENSFALRTLTVNDGLSVNSVFGIEQDSIGYLWFATSNGLNKYDGRSFKLYPKNLVSEGDIIVYDKKIYKDRQGVLWVITGERELEKYNVLSDSFEKNNVFPLPKTIYQDSDLNMFIGTSNNGIFKINYITNDTIQLINKIDFPKNVNEFTEFKNHIWASSTSGIFKIENDNSYKIIKIPIPNNIEVTLINASKNQGLWVGTHMNGLYFLDGEREEFKLFEGFKDEYFPKDIYIHNVFFDSKERLWIGTYGQGIYLIDFKNSNITNLNPERNNPYTLHYNCISSIYEDENETIWFGTDGGGVSYYDDKLIKFQVLTNNQMPQGMNLNMVKSLALDKSKNLWIGLHNYGLVKQDSAKTSIKALTKENSGLNSNKIAFLEIIDDELWIANELHEIQILHKDGTFSTFNKSSNPALDVGYIYEIFQDSNCRIWLTTADDGLFEFDNQKGVMQQLKYNSENLNSLSSNLIFSIAEGSDKTLWAGTKYKGLNRIDTETNLVTRYPQIEGMLRTIYIDKHDNLWIGTNTNGLIFFNPNTNEIINYRETDGLAGNTIFAILADGDNLWLSSNRGISKFDMNNFEIKNFDIDDGLQSLEFNDSAAFKDLDNNVFYFGGLNGINWFNPVNFKKNNSKPKTTISKIEVVDKEYSLYANSKFKHDQNTISFTFSSLHYSAPNKNEFQYKLKNYDKDWYASGNVNMIRYTNLPPNDYEFQVLSSNYDGVWNETPATYLFTILNPWYATNLAKIIYVLLVVLCAFLLYRYLKWRWYVKNQLRLEHDETERLKKLDEFKTKLYTNISHEFRTPLTLISGPIENQLSRPNLTKQDKQELSLVKRSSLRLLNLVNQMLDLSKLKSGNLKLAVIKGDLPLLLNQLVKSFEFNAAKKQINFTNAIVPIKDAWFDREIIEKIVTNLLSNAVKYTPEKGKIHFQTKVQDGQIIMSVINNGNTLSELELPKLFKRYYQTSKHNDGVGIGLSLVKELTVICRGNIVASTMNDDIQFTVTLPIIQSFFNANEISERPIVKKNQVDEATKPTNKKLNRINHNKRPLLLIVEDDSDIRLFVHSIFKNNYQIKQAVNGEEGIKKAIEYIPDVIISDVMMPKFDGIELCNTLKFDERTSHIPIILLTAKSGHENEMEGLKTGADDYITKPFNTERLKIKVEKLIENRRQLQKHFSKTLSINPALAITSTETEFLKRLQTVLDKHITDPEFTSEHFCNLMLISRAQLHRKLKAITNMTTSEFIRSQRLKLAKNLLYKSDATISEIAYQVGFNTPSYFIKCFKGIYQCTPNEFQSKAL